MFKDEIVCGHVLDVLRQLPDEYVDCVVTSLPYWGSSNQAEIKGGEKMPNISSKGGNVQVLREGAWIEVSSVPFDIQPGDFIKCFDGGWCYLQVTDEVFIHLAALLVILGGIEPVKETINTDEADACFVGAKGYYPRARIPSCQRY